MRPVGLAVLLIMLACLHVSTPLHGQAMPMTPRITLTEQHASLRKIFLDLKKLTGYDLVARPDQLKAAREVSFSVTDASLEEVLTICFRDQPLDYLIIGTAIVTRFKTSPVVEIPAISVTIYGRIVDSAGMAVQAATIMVQGTGHQQAADDSGRFVISVSDPAAILVVSSVGFKSRHISLEGHRHLLIRLDASPRSLQDFPVIYDGFQGISSERATGSFVHISNEMYDRSPSPNVLDHLDGITSSLIVTHNIMTGQNQSGRSIRGRSTIFGNPEPLVILDNFPYAGDMRNINPADIESVTILRDAASASVWGVFSGNGVIVITTKKGLHAQTPRISFNGSLTVAARPDLFYMPILTSPGYIEMERFLFANGFYSGIASSPNHQAWSPAVDILLKQQQGLMNPAQAEAAIADLGSLDSRYDLGKYFYRNRTDQQYTVGIQGGNTVDQYYFSGGFDKNVSHLLYNGFQRITLDARNSWTLLRNKVIFVSGISFTTSNTADNNTGISGVNYPYARLADSKGRSLPVAYNLNTAYVDTAGGGQLLDWHFRPLDEIRLSNNSTRLTDYRIDLSIKYRMLKNLDLDVLYRYGRGQSDQQDLHSLQSYFTRNLINEYTSLVNGQLVRNIPEGAILDEALSVYNSHNLRLQANYNFTDSLHKHRFSLIAGAEGSDLETVSSSTRLYGYDPITRISQPVNYTAVYPLYYATYIPSQIPYNDLNSTGAERYLAYFANTSYTYKDRYILTVGIRKDESNLFGVDANKRGSPLWTAGLAWDLTREKFYQIDWLRRCKLRFTDGYSGNVDRSISALTTITINNLNSYGAVTANINNPPNADLGWEKTHIINVGLDFATNRDLLTGSLDFYSKKGKDLIGASPLDPTTGNTQFIGNTADMESRGIDLQMGTHIRLGAVGWNVHVLGSYVNNKVIQYRILPTTVGSYLSSLTVRPVIGRPLYAVYALRWKGLDPLTGDPRGWYQKQVSEDYSSILGSTDLSDLVYRGPATPAVFGSLRNDFSWKGFTLSVNIVYELGYYFTEPSLDYGSVFIGTSAGSSDFYRRWQQTGDEKKTNVPSMVYPDNPLRDAFYDYSEPLVQRGDNIRLRDAKIAYEWNNRKNKKFPFHSLVFYLYANNICILWKANHTGLDPDYLTSIPAPRSVTVGIKMEF